MQAGGADAVAGAILLLSFFLFFFDNRDQLILVMIKVIIAKRGRNCRRVLRSGGALGRIGKVVFVRARMRHELRLR